MRDLRQEVSNKSGLTQPVGYQVMPLAEIKALPGFQQVRFNPTGREFVYNTLPRAGFSWQIDASQFYCQ